VATLQNRAIHYWVIDDSTNVLGSFLHQTRVLRGAYSVRGPNYLKSSFGF